jgi:hypothetical protein
MVYEVAVNLVDGRVRYVKDSENNRYQFKSFADADDQAEQLWLKYSGSDVVACVSVFDEQGVNVCDWEC